MRVPFTLPILVLSLTVAGLAQDPPAQPPRRQPPPPPKNLKVLPPENILRVMQAFRGALGVQCTHCHVQGDFASDENPKKETTRQMLALVKEINAKFPQGKGVSCYTCHRGAVEPVRAIPPQQPANTPPPQQN